MKYCFPVSLMLILICAAGRASAQGTTKKEVDDNIKTLKSAKTWEARKYAIKRLGELELIRRGVAKEATPFIAAALKDTNADVRGAAAEALGVLRYDPEKWAKDLGPLLKEKEKREVKMAAATTLGLVAQHGAFALDSLIALREKEAAKPDGKRDNDYLRTLKDAIVAIEAGFVTLGDWHYIGPFPNENNSGFKTAFPPEKEIDLKKSYPGKDKTTAKWLKGNFTDGAVNNLALFDEKNNTRAVVYLYREIECAQPRETDASFGSDDTLTVWLNGEKIIEEEVYRAAGPDQNKATLKLRQGKNTLLIKICQGDGEWAFYFRVTGVKGMGK